MDLNLENLKHAFWIVGLVWLISGVSYAELKERHPVKIRGSLVTSVSPTKPYSSIFRARPNDYEDEEYFYRNYFSGLDDRIRKEYSERWLYHDSQTPYSPLSSRYEHMTLGTHHSRSPYEGNVRNQFAEQVFRLRVDTAIKKYFEKPERAKELRTVHKTIERMKNYSVKVSKEERSGEFKVGYDVFSDESKLEYSATYLQAGIYHPRFLSTLLNTTASTPSFKIRAHPGIGIPSASLDYQWKNRTIEAALSRPLSSTLQTQLVSIQPLKGANSGIDERYEMRFTYSF